MNTQVESLGGIPISRILGEPQYKVIDDAIKKIVHVAVFEFYVSPELDATVDSRHAWQIPKWRDSEVGQWVLSHVLETPTVNQHKDFARDQYHYVVTVKLYEEDAVYYKLKWC